VTAKTADKTLFLVEAAQAGIFRIVGVPLADIQPLMGIHCPTVLFPYIRETIADAVNAPAFRRCTWIQSISKRCISSRSPICSSRRPRFRRRTRG
jgi:Preprotein translocase subunit SecB